MNDSLKNSTIKITLHVCQKQYYLIDKKTCSHKINLLICFSQQIEPLIITCNIRSSEKHTLHTPFNTLPLPTPVTHVSSKQILGRK